MVFYEKCIEKTPRINIPELILYMALYNRYKLLDIGCSEIYDKSIIITHSIQHGTLLKFQKIDYFKC